MRNSRTRLSVLAAALLLLAASPSARAQAAYQLQPDSKLWVDGTSNRSDWTVHAEDVKATLRMSAGQNAVPQQAKIVIASGKMVSRKSTIMDRLMYDALQVEKHPEIVFELASAKLAASKGNSFTLQTVGRLTLAGTTKTIEMPMEGERLADGQIRFKGEHTLLMTDYGMTPPSAMFGALRTGDKVTVRFDLLTAPGGPTAGTK